jgi:predicted Zn-dependent peptidase
MNINKHTLTNGLRLVHVEDRSTQMVALNILYDVGARDEDPDHTGFAHLFEHLMFGGSKHIPDYDSPVQMAGGENNAWTSSDCTNYYITLPHQNVETAFWLESDRMLSLQFSVRSLEVQRQVVMEEFKQRYLNQPYGDASHLMRGLIYRVHPYQWPTIGKNLDHIAQATLPQVKDFFFSHYAPNNAILVITGHITFAEALRLTKKWFGHIPRRAVQPRQLPVEPDQTEERRLRVRRPVPLDALFMAFPMCAYGHPDYYACDMLSDVLAAGQSSRLIRHLVAERKVFASIDAYIQGSIDAGYLQLMGKPAEGVTLQQAEAAVWEELNQLKEAPLPAQELEKVKNRFESEQIFSNMNYLELASNLAFHELTGQAEDLLRQVELYRAVTPAQLQAVARKTFVKQKACVLYYEAEKG